MKTHESNGESWIVHHTRSKSVGESDCGLQEHNSHQEYLEGSALSIANNLCEKCGHQINPMK